VREAGGTLAPIFWHSLDRANYWRTLARLRILNAVCGPEPETPADRHRQRERDRLRTALPKINEDLGGIVEGSDPPD
jgi:hypothetical protein